MLLALAALAGARVRSGRAWETAEAAAHVESERRASQVRDSAREAFAGLLRELDAQASAASTTGPIRNLAAAPDRATIEDGLRAEPWWQPQRTEFAVSGLLLGDAEHDVLLGAKASEVPASLVQRARASRASSGVVLLEGAVVVLALAVVDLPGAELAPVVVVGKRVDATLLESLSRRARAPLGLRRAGELLAASGEAQVLAEVGAGQTRWLSSSRRWVAASETLLGEGPDAVGLWAVAATEDLFLQAQRSASSAAVLSWLVGAGLALGAVALGFRRPRQDAEVLLRETAAQLQATREQLARLTPPKTGAELLPGIDATVPRMTPGPLPGPIPLTQEAGGFGRYRLIQRLGVGGMGEVHLAVVFGAEGFKRPFVLKRLRPELAREPDLVRQFIDEARLGARLVQANIVPVYDFGKVGEDYFLAQEYVSGRDLDHLAGRRWEQERRPLPEGVVLHVAHAVLDALAYAHALTDDEGRALGLVHRDVSPNNVLVSLRGEVKLLDFGIVKAEGRVSETKSGVVKGNVNCMSPEQARGHAVDARSDLFSLGLTLYRCLSGESLYGAGTAYELLVRAANGPTPTDLQRIRALPDPFGAVLERALQPDPSRRFQSAAEFAAALPRSSQGAVLETAALVKQLFGDELGAEQALLAQAPVPTSVPGAIA